MRLSSALLGALALAFGTHADTCQSSDIAGLFPVPTLTDAALITSLDSILAPISTGTTELPPESTCAATKVLASSYQSELSVFANSALTWANSHSSVLMEVFNTATMNNDCYAKFGNLPAGNISAVLVALVAAQCASPQTATTTGASTTGASAQQTASGSSAASTTKFTNSTSGPTGTGGGTTSAPSGTSPATTSQTTSSTKSAAGVRSVGLNALTVLCGAGFAIMAFCL